MLNILLFSPYSLENGRGGEISSIELARGLHKFYNVTLIDTNRLIEKELLSKDIVKKKLNGIKKVNRMKFLTLNIFNRNFHIPYPCEILKMYSEVKKNNIVYLSFCSVEIHLMFLFFSFLHPRARFIIGYRLPLHSEKIISLYNIRIRLSILIFSLFKKKFYHHTLSYSTKKYLEKFYSSDKIYHIVHGIELDKYIKNKVEYGTNEKLKFVYIGYLDDVHKGVNILANAINQFLEENKNFKLFFEFCGAGPLESKIKKLEQKFPDFVKYNGYINNEEIPYYYKKNDVFLFSSRVEPFPRSIMEALASNLLILCSKTIGSVELLKGKEFAFFIRDLSPEAIKEKIVEIYELWKKNPEKFKNLQQLAKVFIFQNYSFSKELEMFKNLIENIS